MRTSKPFSTICYCKEEFLKDKLETLVNDGILDFYAFVYHSAEEDELKAHAHLYLMPSSLMETGYIDNFLRQFDPTKPDKPLKCTIFQSSKFDDWYLYCSHDKAYLAKKGQSRKYTYTKEQFIVSDEDYFKECIRCIDRSQFIGMERIVEAVNGNMSFAEMVRNGQVPVQLISQYKMAYELVQTGEVYRNGRDTHTPLPGKRDKVYLYDEETGEVLEEYVKPHKGKFKKRQV